MKDMHLAAADRGDVQKARPFTTSARGHAAEPAWTLEAAGFTDRGRVRPSNQDCFRVVSERGLLVVADGMGGHAGGDVASLLAVATVIECLSASDADGAASAPGGDSWSPGEDASMSETANRLRTAFQTAHQRLLEASRKDPALQGMGTTLVVAQQQGDRVVVAWAGDSRLYVRDAEGVRCVTRDDSWLESVLADHPDADADQIAVLRQHPLRNALTNVVGGCSRTETHVVDLPISAGLVVALTTDGVHGALDDRHLAHLLESRPLPADAAADLVAAAMGAGSTDNCTAVVGRWTMVPGSPG